MGAGAVGLLTAAMLRVAAASSNIVICDIDARRVEFATANGFADRSLVVPMKRGATTDEKLAIARETAVLALKASREGEGDGDDFLGFDAVFECTGVESCMQTSIYVSDEYLSCFLVLVFVSLFSCSPPVSQQPTP